MAFDDPTRSRLQRFVNDVRELLKEEFTRQLQNDYGLDPASGTVTALEKLRHLNDAQRETARILRETLAHYCASQEADAQSGLDRIVREQAFTVLNRLAALRMAEARGLIIESVGNGYKATGFQLYTRLAGTGLGETGDAYRVYLFSVFDELALDMPGLFDRYSPQGRLFPREAALLQVLKLINGVEIEALWAEDETIGWIYQYFNSREERKAMRDASQAPRNSRELAVRNQFFTPRYVVEFLVDNTLGRLWYDATGGQTSLRERCRFLLVTPDEHPQASTNLRDPRTLRLLDPACGSMHFGLYAFDLFADIYREAWDWEQQHGPGSLDVSTQAQVGFKALNKTYADRNAFLLDVPRLILEHNIYGIDIDPRAAQIATLALWLRAQRAWHETGVKAKDRPIAGCGNVVAAVAPPRERELRKQFAAQLDLVDAELFEKTLHLLSGLPELGILLQVERELPSLIRQVVGEHGEIFKDADMARWQKAELRLREALRQFAQATESTYQGRLFAEDALQGLRMIDICAEMFDVVVMNPPFGELAVTTKQYVVNEYSRSKNDLFSTFVERATALLRPGGYLGAITNKTGFFLQTFEDWRSLISTAPLTVTTAVDLGFGVLDTAAVETMMYVISRGLCTAFPKTTFVRLTHETNKALILEKTANEIRSGYYADGIVWKRSVSDFSELPRGPYCYWASDGFMEIFRSHKQLAPSYGHIYQGIATGDNFRFLRCRWEVASDDLLKGYWLTYAKGGTSAKWISDFALVVRWKDDGAEIKANAKECYGSASRTIKNESTFFKAGVTYTQVTVKGFFARALPSGCIFDMKGPSVQFEYDNILEGLGVLGSLPFRTLAKLVTDCRQWHPTNLMQLPYPDLNRREGRDLGELTRRLVQRTQGQLAVDETSCFFIQPFRGDGSMGNVEQRQVEEEIDELIAAAFGTQLLEFRELDALLSPTVNDDDEQEDDDSQSVDEMQPECNAGAYAVGVAFGRWDLRLVTGERITPPVQNPFDPLPAKSPGMLPEGAEPFHRHAGILVDDSGHGRDLAGLVEGVLERVQVDGPSDVRSWLRKDFFAFHLQRYSKSRRKAPIYWPLATASGSYTLWVYYPDLSSQTLYSAINDFIEPKLRQMGGEVFALRNKGATRSRDEENQFEAFQEFELELIELRDALLKLAPSYRPSQDDGVQITAAPLWPFFRHKPWQKVLRETWSKLEKGDYDWAHLAMNYWPERVREKCKTGKSLAIAHGLEDLYVEPEAKPKKTRGRKKAGDD